MRRNGCFQPGRRIFWSLTLLALGGFCLGCGKSSPPPAAADAPAATPTATSPVNTPASSASSAPAARPTAQALLAKLAARYRDAISYEDTAALSFTFVEGNEEFSEGPIPFSLTLARPNRLRLHMFQAMLVCDGVKLRAATTDIPGQVLELDAPRTLTADKLPTSEILTHAMTGGIANLYSPQLDLLTNDGRQLLSGGPIVLLEDATTDGRLCYRAQISTPDGPRVLWIDQQDTILRRLDLPTAAIKAALDPEGRLKSVAATIEFQAARIDHTVDPKAFQFEVPSGATRVVHFVPPVSDPPQRVGETLDPFEFVDLQGQPVTPETLKGKVRVLDFWFTTCPPCQLSMPHMFELYQKYKDNGQVDFLAVSVDDPQVADATLTDTLRAWKAEMPIVRDVKQQNQSLFEIPGAPTMFLMDDKNKIHAYQAGLTDNLASFDAKIAALLAGDDVAAQALAAYEGEQRAYELELQKASVDAGAQLIEVPRAEIAPQSEPRLLKLTKLWQADAVREPGNLLVLENADGRPRIFVLDGWRTVVELDADGAEVARHELPIPQRTGVSFLRSAVDSAGKRYFVAAAISQQQMHLFDEQWKLLLSFPEGKHAGIADVQLGDLNGDGQPEILVGYWGDVGVQGVALDGQRLWANRGMQNVMQLAITDAAADGQRSVIGVNSRGTLVPIDAEGEQAADMRLANRALRNIAIADLDSDGVSEWIALAADPSSPNQLGKVVAVGIDPAGKELWSYDLPQGLHKYLVEPIVAGQLTKGDGGWLLPAADGSIHVLTKTGQVVDRFNYGQPLTGLALARINGNPVLLVASPQSLIAYQIGRQGP